MEEFGLSKGGMYPKDADGSTNSVDFDKTAPLGAF